MDTILDGVHPLWMEFFTSDEVKPILTNCLKKLTPFAKNKFRDLCPNIENIFRAFRTSPKDVRVIILGQDPYHGQDQANGLSFSVNLGTPPPPSLRDSIFKCLMNYELIDKQPKHGCLNNWALQGVFMLNASLTTELGKPGEHPWWHPLTDLIVEYLSTIPGRRFFLLWGGPARKKKKLIDESTIGKNIILESQHPSPMANTQKNIKDRFAWCDHFQFVNDALEGYSPGPIDWNLTATTGIFTDGSCPGNGREDATGGWGVYVTSGPLKGHKGHGPVSIYINSSGHRFKRTNVRAELTAVIEALNIYLESGIVGNLIMYIDNEMCVNILNSWLARWAEEDRIDDMKNPDLLRLIETRLNKLKNMQSEGNFTFKAQHVYSHIEKKGKIPKPGTSEYKIWKYNHEADRLANLGATECKSLPELEPEAIKEFDGYT